MKQAAVASQSPASAGLLGRKGSDLAKGAEQRPAPPRQSEAIRVALGKMERAIRDAGVLPSEPVAPLLDGLSDVAAAVGFAADRVVDAVGEARGGGATLSEAAQADLVRRVQSAASAAFERQAIDSARRMTRVAVARASILAAGLMLLSLAVGAAGGYWVAQRQAVATFSGTGAGAGTWLALMRANDIGAAMRVARCWTQDGARACAVDLWMEPHAPQNLK